MRWCIAVILAALICTPAFACGPMQAGKNAIDHGRARVKRQRQHRQAREQEAVERYHEHARRYLQEDNRGELLLESIDGGHGTYSKWSPAETQRRMEARAGHLLRKYKQGRLTNNEAAELQVLMHALSQ